MLRLYNDFRQFKQFDNHEMVINFTDDTDGLSGAIAVHSTKLGSALGGTRIQTYGSDQDALKDVLNLSQAMSYKCALAGLPYGGGKAVINFRHDSDRRAVLQRYAEIVEKLGGLFRTGTDVGVTDDDVAFMAQSTKYMLGVSVADRGELSTSKMAALGVFYSCKAALQHVFGSDDFRGRTITIKGLGKLGGELARLAHNEGAVVIGADIDPKKTADIQKELPDVKIVSVDEIAQIKCDIYAPCALGNEFTSKNIGGLQTKIISGGANNQLVNERVGEALFKKGILYAPDYVVNAGGLIYVSDELEPGGFNKHRVLKRVADIQTTLTNIFERAATQNMPTHRISDQIAKERIS